MISTRHSHILIVDDSPTMIQLIGQILTGLGQLRFATSGEAALQQARAQTPDLILLDAEMPGMKGIEVCKALKADPDLKDTPIIFVTSHSGAEFELQCLEAGAADFLTKPISAPLLVARAKTQLQVKLLTDELRRLIAVDALTETLNRRAFDKALHREWSRSQRNGTPISLLMVDVDHFKRYNDRYGHPAGDTCLRAVATALGGALRRSTDILARYGGEEFVMLLPDTPLAGAIQVAKSALVNVRAQGIPHEDSPTAKHVSCSIGLASFAPGDIPANANSPLHTPLAPECNQEALLACADQALYRAKEEGRNRLCGSTLTSTGKPAPLTSMPH